MEGFYRHIKDAIAINKKRKTIYGQMTNGRSRRLSNLLITSEYLTLPIAKYYDFRGKKYNKRGIEIIKNDFVPMDIADASNSISSNPITKEHIAEIKSLIREKKKILPKSIRSEQCAKNAHATLVNLLEQTSQLEIREGIHLPMIKHIIESMGLIAKNGIGYIQQDPSTASLVNSIYKLHFRILRSSIIFDIMANPFHCEGVGILVNDLPKIEI